MSGDDKTRTKPFDATGGGKADSRKKKMAKRPSKPRRRRLWLVIWFLVALSAIGFTLALPVVLGWISTTFSDKDNQSEVISEVVPQDPKSEREVVPQDPVPEESEVNPPQEELDQARSDLAEAERKYKELLGMFHTTLDNSTGLHRFVCKQMISMDEDALNDLGNAMFASVDDRHGCNWEQQYFWGLAVICVPRTNTPVRLYWQAVSAHRCGTEDARDKVEAALSGLDDSEEQLRYMEHYRSHLEQMLTELPVPESG